MPSTGDLPPTPRREPSRRPACPRIAPSRSVNPRKGADTFTRLDGHLDRDRYELTYLGQAPVLFEWIRAIGPLGSDEVAAELRRGDVYVAASRDDPCSNALLEALACGLPAAYLGSGGHPELVGKGGLPFAGTTRSSRCSTCSSRASTVSARDRDADARLGRRPVPRGSRSRAGRPRLESPAVENYLRRAKTAAAYRLGGAWTLQRSRGRTTSSTGRSPGRGRGGSARRR